MGLKKINLCAMIVCIFAFASVSNAEESWLDKAIIRTAVSWNELDLGHISYLSTYKSTKITYRTRARQYGPSLYRVELDFEGRTPDGGLFFAHKNNYLIMLLTSGQTEAYRDNSSELLYWVDKKFNTPVERRNDILPDEYLEKYFKQLCKEWSDEADDMDKLVELAKKLPAPKLKTLLALTEQMAAGTL